MSLTSEYIKLIKSGRARLEPGLSVDDIAERLKQNGYPEDRIEILLDGDSEEGTRFEKWLKDQEMEQRVRAEVQRLKAMDDPFGPKNSLDDGDEKTLRDLQEERSKVHPEPEPEEDDMSPFPDPAAEMRRGPRRA
jgi:acylphosphatase